MMADHFRNLETHEWTEVGLTNGAMVCVKDIIFDTNQGPFLTQITKYAHQIWATKYGPPNMPKAIVVELDEEYKGPHLPNKPRHVVITPKTTSYESFNNKTYDRTQFPLVLAYALTDHKSQGMMLHKVRVSFGYLR